MRPLVVLGVVLATSGCDAIGGSSGVVARVEGYELRVDRLAQVMAEGKNMPIRREVAQQVANLWVDYAVLAQAIAEGAPLYDSAIVYASMWRDVQQLIADHYYDQVVAPVADVDSARLDSIYEAGEFRVVKHILVRSGPSDPPPVKAERRARADTALQRFQSGLSWDDLNTRYNDDRTRDVGGNLGVVVRGQHIPDFEAAAFALAPGAISGVVATSFGYHLILRPTLGEVYEQFKNGVEELMILEADTSFLDDLAERKRIRVSRSATDRAREAFSNILAHKNSNARLGSYEGGRFRLSEFVRWFEGFAPTDQSQIAALADDELEDFIREVITHHVLVLEARAAGIVLDSSDYVFLNEAYINNLAVVRATMNITDESLGDTAQTVAERSRQLELRIDQYLQAIARNERTFVSVPPYLADTLRVTRDWEVFQSGIDRVIERARELRDLMPSNNLAPRPTGLPFIPPESQ